jgi:MFS family permease
LDSSPSADDARWNLAADATPSATISLGRREVAQRYDVGVQTPSASLRKILVPLALAQFICSFAGSNMNVMITDISKDLDTTVHGVQIAITVFLLVMAALMIPAGKLTDRWGRKRCFTIGLTVYGVGALMGAVAPGLGILIVGNSIFEGVGTALLIPPVYILTTMLFADTTSRARAFGVITGMGGVGAAAGPLIGGLITTAISWRAAFVFQALIVAVIVRLSRAIVDPVAPDPSRPFDTLGAVLSAAGLIFVVMGVLAADNDLILMALLLAVGAIVLTLFFFHIRGRERAGKEALLSTGIFRNRTSNLALVTQNVQWLLLMGTAFVVSAYLQVVRGYNAIETGVIFTAATGGILLSSLAAERLAKKHAQRTLIMAGFITSIAGIGVLLALVKGSPSAWAFAPGLLLIGLGVGVMLTPSVNVVQSAFPEELQGEISGVSRSISNLGSCLGTAVAGTILVSGLTTGAYAAAMIVLALIGIIGLGAAMLLPAQRAQRS